MTNDFFVNLLEHGHAVVGVRRRTGHHARLCKQVTPSTPIATKRTIFSFIVTQFDRGVYKATVNFDGQQRKTNAGGLVRFAATLAYHPYRATASHAGDPGGSVTINPRFVPHVYISVSPARPRLSFTTTFTFHATLEGRPPLGRTIAARRAVISFAGQSRRTSGRGLAQFRVLVVHHSYPATVTQRNALSTSLTIHSRTVV